MDIKQRTQKPSRINNTTDCYRGNTHTVMIKHRYR